MPIIEKKEMEHEDLKRLPTRKEFLEQIQKVLEGREVAGVVMCAIFQPDEDERVPSKVILLGSMPSVNTGMESLAEAYREMVLRMLSDKPSAAPTLQ